MDDDILGFWFSSRDAVSAYVPPGGEGVRAGDDDDDDDEDG